MLLHFLPLFGKKNLGNNTASKLDARFEPAIGKVISVRHKDGQGPVIVEFPDGERHLHSQHLKRVPPPRPDTPPTSEVTLPASRRLGPAPE